MAEKSKKIGALKYSDSSEEYTPQVSGLATIKVGEQFALVTFDNEKKTFDNGTNKKKIALADMPKFPKLQSGTEKKYQVRLNKDGDMVDSIFMSEGHCVAKVIDFGGRKGEADADPTPFEKYYHKGEKDEEHHQEFVVVYKVTKGPMKNATAPYFLHYKFEEDDEGFAKWKGNPEYRKATRLLQLVDFCEKHGLIDEPISWPEDGNILPILLDRALEADREVELIVKDGWIKELLEIGSYDEAEPVDEQEEKPATPAKKNGATKKAPKPVSSDEDDSNL